MSLYVGLVHHPVYNKNMEIIATSVTNLDIHDISRSSTTYGVKNYFIIHPHEAQQKLVAEICGYWREGYGAAYNPDRKQALGILRIAATLEEAKGSIAQWEGKAPKVITTDARLYPNSIGYGELRERIHGGEEPFLLLFGTGYGMEKELMMSADYILHPIEGAGEYNHLSVRSAVAIILDRLMGEKWW